MSCDVAGRAPLPPSLDRLPTMATAAPLDVTEEAGTALRTEDERTVPSVSERLRACEEIENNFLRFVEMVTATKTATTSAVAVVPAAVESTIAAAAATAAASTVSSSDPSNSCLAAHSSGSLGGGCSSDAVDDGSDNVRCGGSGGSSCVLAGLGPHEQQQHMHQLSCEPAVAEAAVDVDPIAAGVQQATRVAFSLYADAAATGDAQQQQTFRRPSSTPLPQHSASAIERYFELLIAAAERIARLQHENSYLRQHCRELENVNRILEVRLQLFAHAEGFILDPATSFESQAAAAASGAADSFTSTKQRNASTLRVHRKPSYKDSLSHDVMWGAGVSTKHSGLPDDAFDKFRLNSSSSGAYSADFSHVGSPHDKTPHDSVGKFKGTIERVKNRLKGTQPTPKTLGSKRHYSSKAKDGGVWIGPSEVSIPEQSVGAFDVVVDQATASAAVDPPRAATAPTCPDEGTSAASAAAGEAGGSEVVSDAKSDTQSLVSSGVPQATFCSTDGAKDAIEQQQHCAKVQSVSTPNGSSVPDESASIVVKDSKEAGAVTKHVGATAKDVGPATRSVASVVKDASAVARDTGAAARDTGTFAKEAKMVTPPMSPSAKKKKKKASRSSSLAATPAVATAATDGQTADYAASLVGSDLRTETVADPYLEALQKVEMTKEFARKYEEWYKRREDPESTDNAGDGGLSTKLLRQGAGSSGSPSASVVAALPPRSPGAPHRRWSTKAATAVQQVASQPSRGGGSGDGGKLRNLPTSRSSSSLAAHGILAAAVLPQPPSDGGACNNGSSGGGSSTGAAASSASGASTNLVWLPQSQLSSDQGSASPAAAVAHAAVVGRSHSSAADRNIAIRPQPAQLAAGAAVLPPASDKSKEKGKQGSSRSRFTQRVRRELEKRLTRSRERPSTRSKSCERTEDKITQDFAEKLREWSVKQGHDPDYYGNRMGSRARSTGSVAKEDELASPTSNGRASPCLKSGASDSSLEGVSRCRQDLTPARGRRAVGDAVPSSTRPPDAPSSSSLADQQPITDSGATAASKQPGPAAASARRGPARELNAVGTAAHASSESLTRNGNDSSAGRQPPVCFLPESTTPRHADPAAVQAELLSGTIGREQHRNAERSDVGSVAGTSHSHGSVSDGGVSYHSTAGASSECTMLSDPAAAAAAATVAAADCDAPLNGLATDQEAAHVATDSSTNSSPCIMPLQPTELSVRDNGVPSAIEPVVAQPPVVGGLVASAVSLQAAAQPATRDSFSELDALVDNVLSNVSSAFRSDARTLPTLVQPAAGISIGDMLQANSKSAAAALTDSNAWTRSLSSVHCSTVPDLPPATAPAVDSSTSMASRNTPAVPSIDCCSDTGRLWAVPSQAAHSSDLPMTAAGALLQSDCAVTTLAETGDVVISAGDGERNVEHSLETCSTRLDGDDTCDAKLDGAVSQVCVGQQHNRIDCSIPACGAERINLVSRVLDVQPAEPQLEQRASQEELQCEQGQQQEHQSVVHELQLLQLNQVQQPVQEYPPQQEMELAQPNKEQQPLEEHRLQQDQQLMLQQEERLLLLQQQQEQKQLPSEQQHLLEKQLQQQAEQPPLEQQPHCALPKHPQQQQCPPQDQQPLLQEQDPSGGSNEGYRSDEGFCRSPADDQAGLLPLLSPEADSCFGTSAEGSTCGHTAVAKLLITQHTPVVNVANFFVDEVSRTVTLSTVATPRGPPSELSASRTATAAACWQPAALSAAAFPAAADTSSRLAAVADVSSAPLVSSEAQSEIAVPLVVPAAHLEVTVSLVPEALRESRPDVNVSPSDSGCSFRQPLATRHGKPSIGSGGHSVGDCGLQQPGRNRDCEQTSALHDTLEHQRRTSFFERGGCGSFSDSADGSSDSDRYDYSESDLIDSSPAETLSTASEELLGGSPYRQLSGSISSVASASPGIVALAWKCDPSRQRSVSMGNCFAVDGDLPTTAEESSAASLADSDVSATSDPALLDTASQPDGHCANVLLGYSRESLSDRLKALAAEYASENSRVAVTAEVAARTAPGRRATNAAESGIPASLSESVGLGSCRLRGVESKGTDHDASLSVVGEKRMYGNSHTMPLMVSGGGGSGSRKALSPRAASTLSVQQAAEKSRAQHPSSVPAAVHALVSRFESQGDPSRLQLQAQQQPVQSALSAAWNLPPRALVSPITKLKSAAELMTADSTKKSGGNAARDELFPCDIPHAYAKKSQGNPGISMLQRKSVKP